jgi:hypothetical protein
MPFEHVAPLSPQPQGIVAEPAKGGEPFLKASVRPFTFLT